MTMNLAGLGGLQGMGHALRQGGGWSPSQLAEYMAGLSGGISISFVETDRTFQEYIGPTPADETAEVIGLAMDDRLWGGSSLAGVEAAATELLTNGAFASDVTSWTANGVNTITWEAGAARLKRTGTQGELVATQPVSPVAGGIYRLSALSSNFTGDSFQPSAVNLASPNQNVLAPGSNVGAMLGYVVATGSTNFELKIRGPNPTTDNTQLVDNASLKRIPGNAAVQATAGYKPTRQAGGWARYDGSDDYHGLAKKMGAAGFVIMRRILLQKTAGTQILFGAVGASGTDRIYFGHDSSGQAVGRIGNGATMSGAVDLLNADGTIGVVWSGTTASLVVDGAVIASQAQSGAPTTTIAPIIGGYNNNGTPGSYCNFDLHDLRQGDTGPDAATLRNIHLALMAA